jgi:imidazolonepropionase-like amidohydrolase
VLSLLLLLAPTPQADPAAAVDVLDVGVALTMEDRRVIHNARILFAGGRIQAVGRQDELPLPGAVGRHWSYPDSFAFPGGVDLHSHVQTGGWGDINDMVHPDNPELRVLDTLVPWNPLYRDACAAGVTTVNGIPGSGTNMGGAGVLVKVKPAATVDEAVMRHPGSVKIAQGYNPERSADLGGSRMGMWWMLRWWLREAREVSAADRIGARPDVEHIALIERRHHPYLVHTAGARDTYGTVRMFQLEAGLPVVVSHASFHGYMAAEDIAAVAAPLNIGPRNFDFSLNGRSRFIGLVQAYEAAGNTDLSVQTDSPVVPQEEFFYQASLAERLGASTWEALESINVDPARQILAEDRLGRLAPGIDADIVVKAGQPLDPRTPVQLVLVDGEIAYDIRDGQRY